jgi:hypothetical protein
MSRPASRRQAITSRDRTKPSQPTKRRNIWPVAPPSRPPRLARKAIRPTWSDDGQAARNRPKPPCSRETSWMNAALRRVDMILAPLRTMRASLTRPSQNSSGWKTRAAGSKPRKAASNPGHLASITLQAKPAENTRLVISARMRSSRSAARAWVEGLGGDSLASPSGPPLRCSARARTAVNEVMMRSLLRRPL